MPPSFPLHFLFLLNPTQINVCLSSFPMLQGALFSNSASSLSTQMSHTSDKRGVISLTIVKHSAVLNDWRAVQRQLSQQLHNVQTSFTHYIAPPGKPTNTPHSRCTLQKVSDTCQKRYRTQWGGRQRHLSGLQTTLLFNWFEMRQVPRGARRRNETLHSLGNSHSSRTVYVFGVAVRDY